MLVLTRRSGEEIVIGGNIHVTVLEVKGQAVRLGITAPRSVPVNRKEVLDRPGTSSPPVQGDSVCKIAERA